jgi:hypothetical protein
VTAFKIGYLCDTAPQAAQCARRRFVLKLRRGSELFSLSHQLVTTSKPHLVVSHTSVVPSLCLTASYTRPIRTPPLIPAIATSSCFRAIVYIFPQVSDCPESVRTAPNEVCGASPGASPQPSRASPKGLTAYISAGASRSHPRHHHAPPSNCSIRIPRRTFLNSHLGHQALLHSFGIQHDHQVVL